MANKRGTHDYVEDLRNAEVLVYINGKFYPRQDASISVFDSGFLLGDGVWEGIRLHNGKFLFLEQHLERLFWGASQIDMDIGKTMGEITSILYDTIKSNRMESGVHVRLIISRGVKSTPYQDPSFTISEPTIVVIPEYKVSSLKVQLNGIKLVSVDIIRGSTNVQDHRINSLSKFNCIQACIDAKRKGGDEGLMLDPYGYVSTCNSTHFFMVIDNAVWTSTGEYCLKGVTRQNIIDICKAHSIPFYERNFTLADVYDADEAFVTGTFGGVVPVYEVDDHELSVLQTGSVVKILQSHYNELVELVSLS
ncbi:MAG TPA: aminotransferase class IV [Candidatus Poseidoniia archaeon]|jgi:branched-chain amino acid aminotransferase|nr:aminotransferase class IV [Candidatus Poseidoniia archaeon]